MNNAPRVNDRSGATLNRLKLILFDRTIPHSERNPNLPALLHSERSGVFNWLLIGWQRLTSAGKFTLPERSAAWLEQYKVENDIELMFVNEMLDFHPTFTVNGQDLYDKYRWWCDSNGYKPRNAANAAKEWRRLGLLDKRNQGRTIWWNARIKGA
jgi:putative DNA primase/helicase